MFNEISLDLRDRFECHIPRSKIELGQFRCLIEFSAIMVLARILCVGRCYLPAKYLGHASMGYSQLS